MVHPVLRARRYAVAVAVIALLALTGCSSDAPPSESASASAGSTTAPAQVPSAVDLTGFVVEALGSAGAGTPANARADALEPKGYTESEYLVSGVANVYAGPSMGPVEVADTGVPFTSRVLVRVPSDPAAFSGRVVVEPFNTSGFVDIDAAWGDLGDRIVEQGDGWVGVTVRNLSVPQLQGLDQARYEALDVPTNAVEWDLLTQLGATLKDGTSQSPLGELDVEHLYMTGYSQSAIDTATYASAFNERARMEDGSSLYDGYLVMSRSGSSTPVDSGTAPVPIFEHLPMRAVDAPVIETNTEGDVEGWTTPVYTSKGGAEVRRDDADTEGDRYRLYEIAGAAHVQQGNCPGGGTTFPQHWILRAAYTNLIAWAEDGEVPATAERIEVREVAAVSPSVRDELGNAVGGLRSPWIDVPVSAFAPADPDGGIVCMLVGVETELTPDELMGMYADESDYLEQFEAAVDASIADRTLLVEDRAAIIDAARVRAHELFSA